MAKDQESQPVADDQMAAGDEQESAPQPEPEQPAEQEAPAPEHEHNQPTTGRRPDFVEEASEE